MIPKKSFVSYSRVARFVLFSLFSVLLSSSLSSERFSVWAAERSSSQNSPSKLPLMFSVQQTLDLQPNIKIAEQEVVSKSASLQESDGRFDLTINSSFGYHESFMPLSRAQKATTGQSSRDEGVGDFTLSFNQELANGIVLQPSLSITRTDDQSFGTDTINDASVNFNLIVPLQKGWGRDVVEAGIRSAQVSVQSSRFSLQHTTAVSIKEMVSAYWNYVAAEKKLTILKNIEDRTRQAVADMQEMVKADESPASELGPLNANLSDKSLSRVAAEQNLVASRHGLGMAIGLTRIDSGSLSRPLDYFPEAINFVADDEVKRVQIVSFATLAKNMRTDLKSLSSNEEALRITLVSARNDLKPQLDLVFSTGYNGLTEGDNWKKSINSLSSRVPGLNYGVALNYQFPYQNNSAKGRLAQIEAALVQARISTSDLERNIVSQVEVVFSALQRSLEELQYSAESVKVYRQVVSDERDKIHLGMGTVIDLVTMVDKLESALLAEVTSQQNYANILLDLRYETGTLISWGEDGSSSLNIKNLIALPDIDRSGL